MSATATGEVPAAAPVTDGAAGANAAGEFPAAATGGVAGVGVAESTTAIQIIPKFKSEQGLHLGEIFFRMLKRIGFPKTLARGKRKKFLEENVDSFFGRGGLFYG